MALSAGRKTISYVPGRREFVVVSGVTIYNGGMVAIEQATGFLRPARATATDKVIGYAEIVEGSVVGDGVKRCIVRSDRVGQFKNSLSADLIANINIGADCYAVDDETVALTSNSNARPRAGKINLVDDAGVGVLFDQ